MSKNTLGIPLFDADNHMYETRDAFTKYLPDAVQGRHRLRGAARPHQDHGQGQDQRVHPQPDLRGRGPSRRQEEYFRKGNPEGKSRREIFGEPMRSIPAFSRPEARIKLMDEQGIDRALMFPTLASLLEERMRDDPDATHAVDPRPERVDARDLDVQLRGPDLRHPRHHLADRREGHRGARVGARARGQGRADPAGAGAGLPRPALLRPARVRSVLAEGGRERDILVAMHSSDSGYERYTNEWEGSARRCCRSRPPAFRMLSAIGGVRSRTRWRRWSATARCRRFPT